MTLPAFAETMRRVITGDDNDGRSLIIVDGPPSGNTGDAAIGGLFEIWHDAVTGALDPKDSADRGETKALLSPAAGKVKVRWFVISPTPEGLPADVVNAAVRERFKSFGAEHELRDQDRHPAMHQTQTLDVICLLSGDVSLVLDNVETRIKPGQVVIQRGTSHGWTAHGGPAMFLAVLIDRR